MAPVIHSFAGYINLFPRTTFIPRKDIQLAKYTVNGKNTKLTSYSSRFILPQSSLGLFQICRSGRGSNHRSRIQIIPAVGTDVTVEEPNLAVSGEDAGEILKISPKSDKPSKTAPPNPAPTTARSNRPRPTRKSEMPPVKDEELVQGASFTGKVRSIQPFGAFIDFGAYTDGLLHVSRMSDGYVKDVGSVMSVGQEVKVRIVEANKESGRISLTMRDNDDVSKTQQRKEAFTSGNNDKPRPARKNTQGLNQKQEEVQKKSKFAKGQILDGTVKNVTRSGAFILLPEGEEGFLPVSEESEGFGNAFGNSSLQVGQDVSVRVLRFARGQATLTMKKEEDMEALNKKLNQGVVHMATNPFELAFRKNKDIAAFLGERERAQKASEDLSILKNSEQIEEKVKETKTKADAGAVDVLTANNDENQVSIASTSSVAVEKEKPTLEEFHEETPVLDSISTELVSNEEEPVSSLRQNANTALESLSEVDKSTSLPESSSDSVLEESPISSSPQNANAVLPSLPGDEDKSTLLPQSSSDSVLEEAPVSSSPHNASVVLESLPEDEDRFTSSTRSSSDSVLDEAPVNRSPQNENAVLENLPEDKDKFTSLRGTSSDSALEIPEPDDVQASSAAVETVEEQVNNLKIQEDNEPAANSSSASLAIDEASKAYEYKEVDKDLSLLRAVEVNGKVTVSESLIGDHASTTIGVEETDVLPIKVDGSSYKILSTEKNESSMDSMTLEGSVTEEEIDSDSLVKSVNLVSSSEDAVPEEAASSQSYVAHNLMRKTPLLVENEVTSSDSKDVTAKSPDASNGQTGIRDRISAIKATISPALVKQLREETGAGMMDCKKALSETGGDIIKAQEFLRKKGLASADKKASRATAEGRVGSYVHDNRIGILVEVNCETDFVSRGDIFKQLVDDLTMQAAACPQVRYVVTEDVPEEFVNKEKEIEMQKEDLLNKPEHIRSKIVDGRIRKRLEEFALLEQPFIKNDKVVVKDLVKQTIATVGENIKVRRFVRYNLGEGLEKKSQDFSAEVAAQTSAKPSPAAPKDQPAERPPTIAVPAALVKQLREETGAGMMDCKKALAETGGDLQKAQEYLRKKGLSSADKKSSRLAAEGRISSYIHDSRIGTLIEVNCETDFVARNEKFKELVDDLAMQVVACPQVEYVSVEDIPETIVNREKEIEMQREDLKSKPEQIRERIVDGRISKRFGDLALLEQPFIRDDSVTVKDLVKQTVAALGENIKVRRFVRLTLGESKD